MINKIQWIKIAVLLLLNLSLKAQKNDYARFVVDTLCSEYMEGRGYVNEGDKKAAEFIAAEFQKIGLETVAKNYYQTFTTSVNSFPGEMELSINNKLQVPGQDYLVEPGSPSIKGNYETVVCNEEDFLYKSRFVKIMQQVPGKILIVKPVEKELPKDEKEKLNEYKAFLMYAVENPAAATIFLTHDKLTWGGSVEEYAKPTITLKVDSVFPEINNVELTIENKFIKKHKTQNVLGYVKGTEQPDSFLVFTAHYDHLGRMGSQTYFPGANDNASGVAMLLSLAKHYQANPDKYTMLFIAFAGEEIGLQGSKYYTENPLKPLEQIKFLVNLDISGTGDDGIQVVNGKVFQKEFDRLVKVNEENELMKQVKIRGKACNSDHCLFFEKGVPCFFIYTLGGITAYHDIYDKSETLPLTAFDNYFELLKLFISGF